MTKKNHALPQPENEIAPAMEVTNNLPPSDGHQSKNLSAQPTKSPWQKRFGSFTDNMAGVRLIEDRENKRMMIQFNEKPSDAVRDMMKSEPYQYRYDTEQQVWYKPISPHTPVSSRGEAQELAFKVADLIRSEQGLEPRVASLSI